MPTYYLLGGENTHRRSAAEINQAAFNDAGGEPRVLVFAWARASFDRTYQKRKLLFDYFRSLGAHTVQFVDYSSTQSEIAVAFNQTDLVYLTGGVPTVLLERLKKFGVGDFLAAFSGVVVGRSAGALALCEECVVTGRNSKAVRVIEGLGLVGLALKAHYKPFRDNQTLRSLSKEKKIYAVEKDSAIVYTNGNLSFLNKVYLFFNGESQQVSGF